MSLRLGIMQPYFFPYIGYWQLIKAVDKFIIFDDVNYINRGWINRNRILFNGSSRYFNIRIHKASQNKLINELEIIRDENKSLELLHMAYRNAPYYQETRELVKNILSFKNDNLAEFLENQIREICIYLNILTDIVISSEIKKNNDLHGQDRIIDICELMNAGKYVNAIGGIALYQKSEFLKHGIDLNFIESGNIYYEQYNNEFVPNLSIIDVMMFNSVNVINTYLDEYKLI